MRSKEEGRKLVVMLPESVAGRRSGRPSTPRPAPVSCGEVRLALWTLRAPADSRKQGGAGQIVSAAPLHGQGVKMDDVHVCFQNQHAG